MIKHRRLNQWIEEVKSLCSPDRIHICDGSQEEYDSLMAMMVEKGIAIALNPEKRPGCYLFRSHPSDVARVENRTYISSVDKDSAGPTNNWVDPKELKATMTQLYRGSMKGRTMYIIPFSMGPLGSSLSKIGVEITDSPYVVANMMIMTRVGKKVLELLGKDGEFIPCLHSVGYPLEPGQEDPPWPCAPMEKKYISHFPEERLIWSYGSGYGGNALLGKKCLALRIASAIAKDEGWLAEHMLILRITSPEGKSRYITGAFPSACGKTNLAMLVPTLKDWKVETVGDDIAWMKFGDDGQLYAINPEAGFFGVAPGTSYQSNPNAMKSIEKNTIFTNVALTDDGDVWWEGIGHDAPEHLIDWQGNDWYKGKSEKPAAHPNARFTTPAAQCPAISDDWEDKSGVPISAILIGGRRPSTIPLANESKSWEHGVFLASIMGSEITAAAIDDNIGKVRRDPFAMLPFIGYHVGDYFKHWLDIGKKHKDDKLPRIYYVNWFRKNQDNKFIWPGYGDNSRILKWIFQRLENQVSATEFPIGNLPQLDDLDLEGLKIIQEELAHILSFEQENWKAEALDIEKYYKNIFQEKLPAALSKQLEELKAKLGLK